MPNIEVRNDVEAAFICDVREYANIKTDYDLQEALAGQYYWGGSVTGSSYRGIVDEVWDERKRQIAKRGLQERASGTDAGEWADLEDEAKAEHDGKLEAGTLTWVDILKEEVYEAFAEEDPDALEVELIQVMAVAASWLQDLRRRGDQAP